MSTPAVSVVIAVYCDAARLPRSVRSIQAQSFTDWEIVIADDGSTDDSLAVARALAAEDHRIRVLALPHGGAAHARNRAVGVARGEWVAIQDCDDRSLPARMQRQVDTAREHPTVGVVGAYGLRISSTGRPMGVVRKGPLTIQAFRRHRATRPTYVINGTVLMRRDLFLEVGGYPEDYHVGEDLALYSLRLAPRCDIVTLAEPLVAIEMHRDSLSRMFADEVLEADEVVRLNLARRLRGEPELGFPDAVASTRRLPPLRALARRRRQLRYRWFAQAAGLFSAGSPRAFALLLLSMSIAPAGTMKRVIDRAGAIFVEVL